MSIYHDGSDHNAQAIHTAAKAGLSNEHLLALALPNGYEVGYGGSDCETCGYNYDDVTWYFHGPDSVSYSGRFGCYGGAMGERVTFDQALAELPRFVPEDGEHTPALDRAHLDEMWADHAELLDTIKEGTL